MADEDEIDILGDFSFNSCFAQNNQGIPSCSNREDTVHPQWLLDSTETNWYDKQSNRCQQGSPRKLYGNKFDKNYNDSHTTWSPAERELLISEMAKYGRNVHKISQTLKTKTEAEIQALIEAEYGVYLETPSFGLDKHEDHDNVPTVVQEEIVTDDMTSINNTINMFTTGGPMLTMPKKPFRTENNSKSLLKPNILDPSHLIAIDPAEILHEDDLILGSTESIGSDLDNMSDNVPQNVEIDQGNVKAANKIRRRRRTVSRNYDKGSRNKSKELMKSRLLSRRRHSSLSEGMNCPKMIVLGSGLTLRISEGEEVIKIEKKNDSDPESDIDIDVDSDSDGSSINTTPKQDYNANRGTQGAPVAVPLRNFEPMPKRLKKINLDGDGGYTIMHTADGDLFAVGTEPRRERQPRKEPVQLLYCQMYNERRPAPFKVRLHVSTLLLMDGHAHTSLAEVMGLLGGGKHDDTLTVTAYRVAAAAADNTHCEMDAVSQDVAADSLRASGWQVCGWQHSHPQFPASPSALDVSSQRAMQMALDWTLPFVGFITSPHWRVGRTASQYRCIHVESDDRAGIPTGYQFSVKLVPDLMADTLPDFLQELKSVMLDFERDEFSVDMVNDVCPEAGRTYLEKFISSASHHLRSADYDDDDPIIEQIIQGIRDVFR